MTVCCHEFDVHKFEYARSKLFLVYDSCVVDLNLWRNYFLMFSIRFKTDFITFSELTNGNFRCATNWISYISPSSWVSHPSPHSTPLGHHGAPGWAPYTGSLLKTSFGTNFEPFDFRSVVATCCAVIVKYYEMQEEVVELHYPIAQMATLREELAQHSWMWLLWPPTLALRWHAAPSQVLLEPSPSQSVFASGTEPQKLLISWELNKSRIFSPLIFRQTSWSAVRVLGVQLWWLKVIWDNKGV